MMRLTGPEFAELAAALRDAFDTASFDRLLVSIDQNREDYIATTASFPDIIRCVVQGAEAANWTTKLIEGALKKSANNPSLLRFLADHPERNPANSTRRNLHVCDTPFVNARKAFLARQQLRAHLKVMGNNGHSRVVVINGDRFSGKTYSRELITYVAEQKGRERAVYVDLDKGIYDADALAESIGRQMGLQLGTRPVSKGEQDARWVPELVAWIAAAASDGRYTWWIILDGFRVQALPQPTIDMINNLAETVEVNAPQLRVALINYDKLAPNVDYYVCKEFIEPVQKEDVRVFLAQACLHLGVTRQPEEISSAADEVWRQVEDQIRADPKRAAQRLWLLNVASKNAADRLAKI